MPDAFYLILFAAVGCFLASRIYILIFTGELNVKGVVYSRRRTPISYGFTMIFALAGAVFSFTMCIMGLFKAFGS